MSEAEIFRRGYTVYVRGETGAPTVLFHLGDPNPWHQINVDKLIALALLTIGSTHSGPARMFFEAKANDQAAADNEAAGAGGLK